MKKALYIIALTFAMVMQGQVKGNGNIISKTIAYENLTDITISIYADITIDADRKAGITLTGESNLLPLIDTEVVDGKLQLDQLKWIQPTKRIQITIGAPNLKRVEQGTNDNAKIINLNREFFTASALNGKLELSGRVGTLNISNENGTVDAAELTVDQVELNIWGWGKAIVAPSRSIGGRMAQEAEIELRSNPTSIDAAIAKAIDRNAVKDQGAVQYIRFKIKNNSANRHQFYVVGPKPEGGKFSYGFPMMPGSIRKEHWTTGTKVYKISALGIKKLIRKIEIQDEDTVVKLF
ncbi:DUF2807 domain-containing protein [Flagellimonas sp. DF-77]|uniref:GIN domain-containing protein n=1 Tax=Flagellimonas algarum TaxID=3230298 RepID=UPI003399BB59